MVRKKQASTAMDSCIYELERRLQELEDRNQRRFEEAIARIEEMFTFVWQQRQAKRQPGLITDGRNGISKLENFSDTKPTPEQPSLVEDRFEETVLERGESSSQNFKKQGATTSSILETKNGDRKKSCGVKTERRNQEIWSKENIEKAVKMKGIAIKKKSHRKLTEERPSERKGMEPHESFLGVRKGHHHRCSIGGGVINRRAVLNRRKQKQFATARALRPVINRRAVLNGRKQKQLAIARKFKNLKPPWSRNENAKQGLVSWGNRGTVKKKCKVKGSWSPPSTSRPPDAVTTTGERPNWRTFPLARESRYEGGEKGDINVNTKRGNCGKEKMLSIQLPSPSELPTTVAIDKGWLDLTSPSFTQGEARDVQDEARRVQWELHVMGQIQGNVDNWDLGLILNQAGQAQNACDKRKKGNKQWILLSPTRNLQSPDPNAQGRKKPSSLFLTRASSLRVQPAKRVSLFLPSAGYFTLTMGWLLMKPPWVSISFHCCTKFSENDATLGKKLLHKLQEELKFQTRDLSIVLGNNKCVSNFPITGVCWSKGGNPSVVITPGKSLPWWSVRSGKWIARRVFLHCTYPPLSRGDLSKNASPCSLVDWRKGEPLKEIVKNTLLELKAAQFLFDKMLVRKVTDGDMVISGYTRNNSVEVDQSPCCDLNDNGTIENKDTMLGTIMKTKITSIILMGCMNITADMVEKIILSLPGLCTIDVRGCNQFGELTPTFTNVKWFTSWSSRSGVWWAHLGKQLVNNNFHSQAVWQSGGLKVQKGCWESAKRRHQEARDIRKGCPSNNSISIFSYNCLCLLCNFVPFLLVTLRTR